MENNGLQSIATEIQKNNRLPLMKAIMGIIFVLPIIIHSFKWGWIFPLISLSLFDWFWYDFGVIGLILAILIFIGSIILCIWRVRKMRQKRKTAYVPRLYTPPSMRDYD